MPRVGLPPHVQVPQAHVAAAATAGVVPMPSDYRSRRHSSQRPLEPAVTSHHCSWEFGKGTVTCLRHGQDALYYPANSARTLVCPVCSLSLLKCTHRSLGGAVVGASAQCGQRGSNRHPRVSCPRAALPLHGHLPFRSGRLHSAGRGWRCAFQCFVLCTAEWCPKSRRWPCTG